MSVGPSREPAWAPGRDCMPRTVFRPPLPVMKYCITIPIALDATQYRTSPTGKIKLKNPNTMGNIRVIMRCCHICWASTLGDCTIFCCPYIVNPESPTSTNASGLPDCIGCSARSIPKNPRLTGTTVSRTGSHPYSLPANPARLSGVNGTTKLIAQKSPMNIGIWMIMGPRQPMGFMPISL